MTRDAEPPDEIRRLADARRTARAERDWPEADRIKAEIERAGWRVEDQGRAFVLRPAHPPDEVDGGIVRHGSSDSVPSVLDEPPTADITLLRAVPDHVPHVPDLAGGGDPRIQVVLVAHRPSADLPSGAPEVVLLNGWPGMAAALNAGLRRARGAVVVVADAGLRASADDLRAVAAAMDDPTVAVAGPWGLRSDDLRHWRAAAPGAAEATAIDGHLLGFRRADAIERGPIDEAFLDPYRLDAWWSLILRDEGPDRAPRSARVVAVGVDRPPDAAPDRTTTPSGSTPGERRNFYRLIRHFGGARHLVAG